MATKKIQMPIEFDTIDDISPIPATEFSSEQLQADRNYYDFDILPKYKKHMPPQAELMEKVNGKYITLEEFLTEIQPYGQMWVSCKGTVVPFSMSWEPFCTNFSSYGRKEYAGLLKCIVEVCGQGLLYLHYNYPNRAHQFVCDVEGISSRSRIAAVFG